MIGISHKHTYQKMSQGMHYKIVESKYDNQPSVVGDHMSAPQVNAQADVGLPLMNPGRYTESVRSAKVAERDIVVEQQVETTDILTDFDKITIEIDADAVFGGNAQMLFVWVPRRTGQLHCKKSSHCVVVKATSGTETAAPCSIHLGLADNATGEMDAHLAQFRTRAVKAATEKNPGLSEAAVTALIIGRSDIKNNGTPVIEKLVWGRMTNNSDDYAIGINISDRGDATMSTKLSTVTFTGATESKASPKFNYVLDPKMSMGVTSTHYDPDGSFIRASRVSETDPFLTNSHGDIPKYEARQLSGGTSVVPTCLHDLHVLWGIANLGTLLEIYADRHGSASTAGMDNVTGVMELLSELDEVPSMGKRTLGKRIGDVLSIACQLGGVSTMNSSRFWKLDTPQGGTDFVYNMPGKFYDVLVDEFTKLFNTMTSFNTSSNLTISATKLGLTENADMSEPASAILHLSITAYYPRYARMYLPLDYSSAKSKK